MGCLTVRWRKRSSAAGQARFMGTYAQKDASSERSTLNQSRSTFSVAHAKRFSMSTSETGVSALWDGTAHSPQLICVL